MDEQPVTPKICISAKCDEVRKRVNQDVVGSIPIRQVMDIIEELRHFVNDNYSTNLRVQQARDKANRCEAEMKAMSKDYAKYKRTLETLKNACHKRVGSVFTKEVKKC
jgi:hypothetical protein